MTKILAIDTSGQQACAAIVQNSHNEYIVIGEISLNARTGEKSWTHSEILMPAIDQLLNLTGISMQELDHIAYTSGPGSFTGLRIGASTALGLAKGLNKPTIPVPTLDSLAYNMLGTVNGIVVPMMDARRGQVYSAAYESVGSALTRTTEYLALPVEEMLRHCECSEVIQKCKFTGLLRENRPRNDEIDTVWQPPSYNIYVLGDGACAYKETIQSILPQAVFIPGNNNRQRASSVAICAFSQIKSDFVPDDNVEILYVRAPQAVQDLKNKEAKT